MVELLGPEGINFFGKRGVNAADPLHDKDVVNLRSLRYYLDVVTGSTSGGTRFQVANVGAGFPVYAGLSSGTFYWRTFSAGTNLGLTTGNTLIYYLQDNIKVSGLTASTVQVLTLSGNCNNIVTVDCFGNLTTSANTTVFYANLSAGTSTEVISGTNVVTIRHTLWETGRTTPNGAYSTQKMAVQLQNGLNVSDGVFSLVAGSANTINYYSNFSNILGGKNGYIINSPYSFIGNGINNYVLNSSYSFFGNGNSNYIGNYSRFSSILNGTGNTILGNYSTIAGGYSNVSSGFSNFIGAGINNYTNGQAAIVVGGNSNYSYGNFSSIVGGAGNKSYGTFSSISNGFSNSGLSAYTTVVNGSNNISKELFATIVNGYNNQSQKPYSFIGNGLYGNSNSNFASILTGSYNSISATSNYGTIINGTGNTIDYGFFNTINQGNKNLINNSVRFQINNGSLNSAKTSTFGSIINGNQNYVNYSSYLTLENGKQNRAYVAYYSSIKNGKENYIGITMYSDILNGYKNRINRLSLYSGFNFPEHSNILGGKFNTGYSSYSNIINGRYNFVKSKHSLIGSGIYNQIGDKIYNNRTLQYSSILNGLYNQIFSFSPSLDEVVYPPSVGFILPYNVSSTILNGIKNTATTSFTTILNGTNNLNIGINSLIGNGHENSIIGSFYSTIHNGVYNFISGSSINCSFVFNCNKNNYYNSIVNGFNNKIYSYNANKTIKHNSIINGRNNKILVTGSSLNYSTILNGLNNSIYKSGSTITGGKNISITLTADTTAVPYLRITNIYQGPPAPHSFQFLTIDDTNGYVFKTGITLGAGTGLTFNNLGNLGSPAGNIYSSQNLGTVYLRSLSGGNNIQVIRSLNNNYVTINFTGNTVPSLSAGSAIQIITGLTSNDPVTIRHTLWETGRTNTGAYSTAIMPVQLQHGDNQASANFALVAGKSNSAITAYSTVLNGRLNVLR